MIGIDHALAPYTVLAKNVAKQEGLSPVLLLAIVFQESAGRPWVTRFEPLYKYLYLPNAFAKKLNYTLESEVNLQKTSFGLCQIMGAVAREIGRHEGYLTELCLPSTNLTIAAKYLINLQNRFGSVSNTISAYNAGTPRKSEDESHYDNQSYVDSVIAHMGVIAKWDF